MRSPLSQKTLILILGDIAVLYTSLALTLFIRYGEEWQSSLDLHFGPFSFVFAFWLLIFYVAGLYDLRRLKNNITFLTLLSLSIAANALITIALFYFIQWFGIAPRANLSLFIIIFVLLVISWRRFFNTRIGNSRNLFTVLLVGDDPASHELAHALKKDPQIGYQVTSRIQETEDLREVRGLEKKLRAEKVDVIVIPRGAKQNAELQKIFYDLLASGIAVYDVPAFYEEVFRKVPLKNIEESWFLEHISIRPNVYDNLKRLGEIVVASLALILLSPLLLLIAVLVLISSRGPVIFSQKRIGGRNTVFTLHKFRTMIQDAEKNGAQWSEKNDPRVTFIGKILRYSHLDELPQLWNIARGDLSFVGPRPERPEFVSLLEKEIPYYDIRHLITPGVTGWAQINYRYGSSVQDSFEKLQYDIYYLKNRSLILDIAVILKTLRTLFVNHS